MAQRLVRCVCDNCKETYAAAENELRLLGPAAKLMTGSALYRGRGCNKCSLTGYYGRKGIFEIFTVTEEIQRMIYNKVPATELRVRARENGMRTLREDGLRKTAAGVTTVEEVMRNTMGDLD
jgi:type II secretory ATPase GspE/PulE/Tfp pilus assembly ATPase PilB-like protein